MKKALQPPKGIFFYPTENGWPVVAVHHLADPDKNEQWAEREEKKYASKGMWDQEQNMKFGAGAGERLLREMLTKNWDKIVIRDNGRDKGHDQHFEIGANWSFGAGFDYGQAKPTAWVVMAKDHRGCVYALAEHYRSGTMWTPSRHAEAMHGMYLQTDEGPIKALELVNHGTFADPSIFDTSQAQQKGDYVSIASLYEKAQTDAELPVHVRMKEGVKGDDIGFVYKLLAWWSMPDPMFKIVLHPRHNYAKKCEGTFTDGCPNLIRELMGIRRAVLPETVLENKNPTEKIVNKNNHAFDAIKYYFSGNPHAAQYTAEEVWQRKVRRWVQDHPETAEFASINQQIRMRRQFDDANKKSEAITWH